MMSSSSCSPSQRPALTPRELSPDGSARSFEDGGPMFFYVNPYGTLHYLHLFQGDQVKSLFNNSLRASFPARLAAAVVSK